jgi:hypothetical protein
MARAWTPGWRLVALVVLAWAASAALTWLLLEPAAALVGARAPGLRSADLALFKPVDLSDERAVLEVWDIWGIERDGREAAPAAAVEMVEKKIVWSVAATVIRPKERYLLILDQGTRAINVVRPGEKLPDSSKVLEINAKSYSVRMPDGKKRTVETDL